MGHKLLMAILLLLLALVASFAAGYVLAISLMVMRGVILWEGDRYGNMRHNKRAVQGGHPVRLARIIENMIFIAILADLGGIFK